MNADDEPELLTYDEAVALLRDTPRREVTGAEAQAAGHGLAAFRDGMPAFIATRKPS